jgi:hypothetical protein
MIFHDFRTWGQVRAKAATRCQAVRGFFLFREDERGSPAPFSAIVVMFLQGSRAE